MPGLDPGIHLLTKRDGLPGAGPAMTPDDSQIHYQPGWIFQNFLHPHQERHRLAAIDDAVVVAEREIHHRSDLHLPGDCHGTLLDLVHSEDARLRRVQDRRGHQRAVHSAIGDREGAALHLLDLEHTLARAPTHVGDLLLDLRERFAIAVADHRHDEALLGPDRDADMIVVLVDEVGAVDLGVDGRDFLERLHARLYEEAHEAQLHAVLLLEQFLVLIAQVHHRAHVDLIEGREHGSRALRLLEPARDGLAQPGHLHALFACGIVRRRRRAHLQGRGGLSDRGRSGGSTLDRRHHVALGHAAVLAGARNGRCVDARLRRQPAHGRRNPPVLCRLRCGLRAQPRLLFRCVDRRGGVGLLVRPPCRGRRGLAGRALAFLDLPEQRADGDRLAVLGRDVTEYAGGRRWHFDGHLVGLELDQRLIDRNRITRFLEPFADCCFGYGFAESGHADVSHGAIIPCGRARRWKTTEDAEATTDERRCVVRCGSSYVPRYPSAASNSALSCLRCKGIWPTAVAAAGARPA